MNSSVALITGGMGGLGTAMCKTLSDDHVVVANCLPGFTGRKAWEEEMKKKYFEVTVCEADVSDHDACKAMIDNIEEHIGPIAILVNNAGITRDNRLLKMEESDWDAVLNVNLKSVFNTTKHVLPKMVERGYGRIINISSVNGVKGQFGQANYAAAKAGILGFTKSVALEVAKKGVTVNAIAPGYIATDMVMAMKPEVRKEIVAQVPMGRLGTPQEIAELVAYLASKNAGFMTGATLNINGGMHMC